LQLARCPDHAPPSPTTLDHYLPPLLPPLAPADGRGGAASSNSTPALLFVDADAGDDANSGLTLTAPLRSLAAAVAMSRTLPSPRHLVLRGRHYLVRCSFLYRPPLATTAAGPALP
jgi:hypothetical protein